MANFQQRVIYPDARLRGMERQAIAGRSGCRLGWGIFLAASVTLLASGCGDGQGGVNRLSPRDVPFLSGVPVPAKFDLVDKNSEDYESGGRRWARHSYCGNAAMHAVRDFYREQMPLVGWNRVSDQNVKGTIRIRYEKNNESCTVQIEQTGPFNRCTIQVIVMPFSRTPTEPPDRRPVS